MRVFVLGKPREVTHWTEDCLAGFQAAGHETCLGVTRDPRLAPGLERALMADWSGGWLARRMVRAIQAFRPDLILAVRAFATPLPLLARVAALAGRPPLVGWVGDRFSEADRWVANHFDLVGYTDTGMQEAHQTLGFTPQAVYLPHAANPRMTAEPTAPRTQGLVFVANPTPHRRAIVDALDHPITLVGPGWTASPGVAHHIDAHRIGSDALAGLYATHAGALNIHHETNVAQGLNQRHFDPPLFGTPVLSDAQADLTLCFEPGHDVLVWHDQDELNELHARVRREPAWAEAIGQRARHRVQAEHLYGHRLDSLARRV